MLSPAPPILSSWRAVLLLLAGLGLATGPAARLAAQGLDDLPGSGPGLEGTLRLPGRLLESARQHLGPALLGQGEE